MTHKISLTRPLVGIKVDLELSKAIYQKWQAKELLKIIEGNIESFLKMHRGGIFNGDGEDYGG